MNRKRRLLWILAVAGIVVGAGLGASALRESPPKVAPKADLSMIEKRLNLQLRLPPPSEAEVVSARIVKVQSTSFFDGQAALIVLKWRGHTMTLTEGSPSQAWSVPGMGPKVPWTLDAINRPDEQTHVLSDGSMAVILPKVDDLQSPATAYWVTATTSASTDKLPLSLLVGVTVPNSPENFSVSTDDIRTFLELMT